MTEPDEVLRAHAMTAATGAEAVPHASVDSSTIVSSRRRPSLTQSERWTPWAVVTVGVLIVRISLWASGYGLSTAFLERPSLWHLLDPAELSANPLAPIWDLHIQPPLFNVFVGAVLRWSPLPDAFSFQLLFTVGALVGAIALYEIVRAYSSRRWVAATAAIVTFSDPMLLAHEHQVMQEPLSTPLMLVATWTCLRYARRPSLGRLAGFAGAGTALALTRAQFHPIWLILGLMLVMAIRPPTGSRRKVALIVALPLVVLGGLMVKNEVRFGQFTLSSWFGMNLSRTTTMTAPPEQVEKLVDKGVVSPLATEWTFARYETYAPHMPPCTEKYGTPRLDSALKSDGSSNFNHVCYLPVYNQAGRDALAFMRAEPATYARSVRANTTLYLGAPLNDGLPGLAGGLLEGAHHVLALEFETDAAYPVGTVESVRVQGTIVLSLVAIAMLGTVAVVRAVRGRRTPAVALAAFVGFTVVFVSVTSVLLDSLENARFRSPIDPLLWAVAVVFLLEGIAWLIDRGRSRAVAPGTEKTAGQLP